MSEWRPQMTLRTVQHHGRPDTSVDISETLPHDVARGQWRATTAARRLSPQVFSNTRIVNEGFSDGRGRSIALVDLSTQLTVAAIAFHIDRRRNVGIVLRAVALPLDEKWQDAGHLAVAVLLSYLHELSRRLKYGGAVAFEPPTRAAAVAAQTYYGFRRAPGPSGRRSSGPWLIRDG